MNRLLIVVATNDPALAEALSNGLNAHGHAVLQVGSSEALRSTVAKGSVELVVVDGLVAGTAAADVLTALRADRPTIPAVVVRPAQADARMFRHLRDELGARFVVYAPLELASLIEAVQVLLVDAPLPLLRAAAASAPSSALEAPLEALARLQADYGASLGKKLDEVAAAIGDGGSDLSVALGLLHRLHGTAGSFGYSHVSDVARRAAILLRDIDTHRADQRPTVFETALSLLRNANITNAPQ